MKKILYLIFGLKKFFGEKIFYVKKKILQYRDREKRKMNRKINGKEKMITQY
jgi:hypothetical protein